MFEYPRVDYPLWSPDRSRRFEVERRLEVCRVTTVVLLCPSPLGPIPRLLRHEALLRPIIGHHLLLVVLELLPLLSPLDEPDDADDDHSEEEGAGDRPGLLRESQALGLVERLRLAEERGAVHDGAAGDVGAGLVVGRLGDAVGEALAHVRVPGDALAPLLGAAVLHAFLHGVGVNAPSRVVRIQLRAVLDVAEDLVAFPLFGSKNRCLSERACCRFGDGDLVDICKGYAGSRIAESAASIVENVQVLESADSGLWVVGDGVTKVGGEIGAKGHALVEISSRLAE